MRAGVESRRTGDAQEAWPEVGVVQEINVHSYGDVSTISYEIEVVTLRNEIETQFTSSNGIDDVVHSASGQHRRKSKGFFGSLFGKKMSHKIWR